MTMTTTSPISASPISTAPITTPSTDSPPLPTVAADHDTNPRTAALIAGVSYVILFALGVFANFFVREGLIVADDAGATAANIAESEGLFRLGMASFLVVFVLDVIVAWALYIVFRKANRDVSLLTAWFRLLYTVFLGVALVYFFQALQLFGDAGFLSVVDTAQREAQALVALDTFNSAWLIGLAGFGIHLVFLGGLILQSGYAPKLLGYLLIAAGGAYVIDTLGHTLLGNYADFETLFLAMVAIPAVIAEGWMGLWLLFRGGKEAPVRS